MSNRLEPDDSLPRNCSSSCQRYPHSIGNTVRCRIRIRYQSMNLKWSYRVN